ncbi:DgyrCDS3858 [Dimorphilus gyrociliatus]|uniref:Poly [ADP-ribose] polymerase n=1 Tax=Dimorphilus gyrociliatus TaxID=2664684 RepID=A0A7I8VHS6_9ANNE|nr:DgyrCDS3858 [Dimorphilus gyrociliatus]
MARKLFTKEERDVPYLLVQNINDTMKDEHLKSLLCRNEQVCGGNLSFYQRDNTTLTIKYDSVEIQREYDEFDEDELIMIFGIPIDEGGGTNFGIKDLYRIDKKHLIIQYIHENFASKHLKKRMETDDETGEKFLIYPPSFIGICDILCERTIQLSYANLFSEKKLAKTLKLIKSDINLIEYNYWPRRDIGFISLKSFADVKFLLERKEIKLRNSTLTFEKFNFLDFISYKLDDFKDKLPVTSDKQFEKKRLSNIDPIYYTYKSEFHQFVINSTTFQSYLSEELKRFNCKLAFDRDKPTIVVSLADGNDNEKITNELNIHFKQLTIKYRKIDKLIFNNLKSDKVTINYCKDTSKAQIIGKLDDVALIVKQIEDNIKENFNNIELFIDVKDELCKRYLIDNLFLKQIQTKYPQVQLIETKKPSVVGISAPSACHKRIEFEILHRLANIHFTTINTPTDILNLWSNEFIIKDELTKKLVLVENAKNFKLSVTKRSFINIIANSEETLKDIENLINSIAFSFSIPIPKNIGERSVNWLDFKKDIVRSFQPLKLTENESDVNIIAFRSSCQEILDYIIENFKILNLDFDEFKIRRCIKGDEYEDSEEDLYDVHDDSLIYSFINDNFTDQDSESDSEREDEEIESKDENSSIKTLTKTFYWKEHTYPLNSKNMEVVNLKKDIERQHKVLIENFNVRTILLKCSNEKTCTVRITKNCISRSYSTIILIFTSFDDNLKKKLTEYLDKNINNYFKDFSKCNNFYQIQDQNQKKLYFLLNYSNSSTTLLSEQLKLCFNRVNYDRITILPNFHSTPYTFYKFDEINLCMFETIAEMTLKLLPEEIDIQIKSVAEENITLAVMSSSLYGLVYQQDKFKKLNHCVPKKSSIFNIIKGSITKQKADVIANISNKQNLISTPISKKLIKRTKELKNRLINHQNGCYNFHKKHEVLLTKGFGLNCKFIFHSALKQYSGKGDEKNLIDLLVLCFDKMRYKNSKSICFPSFFEDDLNYPPEVVARCIEEIGSSYGKEMGLENITLVISNIDIFEKFEDYFYGKPWKYESGKFKLYGNIQINLSTKTLSDTKAQAIICPIESSLALGDNPITKDLVEKYSHLQDKINKIACNGDVFSYRFNEMNNTLLIFCKITNGGIKNQIFKTLSYVDELNISSIAIPTIKDNLNYVNISGFKQSNIVKAFHDFTSGLESLVTASSMNLPYKYDSLNPIIKSTCVFFPDIITQVYGNELFFFGFEKSVKNLKKSLDCIIKHHEQKRIQKEHRNLLQDCVQWKYLKDSIWIDFSPQDNILIERNYSEYLANNYNKCKFGNDKSEISIFFQCNENHLCTIFYGKSVNYPIKRHDKASLLPFTWQNPKSEEFSIYSIDPCSEEYSTVVRYLDKTAQSSYKSVIKIEKIQNPPLYKKYQTYKQSVIKRIGNPDFDIETYPVWHGTSKSSIDAICKGHFDRNFAGKHAVRFGIGSYFAKNASYPINNGYASRDEQGQKRLFLCRIITGKYCKGSDKMPIPKVKNKPSENFDSTVNNVEFPTIYVIFHDDAAYPEYLVTLI